MSGYRRKRERATYSCLIWCNYPFKVATPIPNHLSKSINLEFKLIYECIFDEFAKRNYLLYHSFAMNFLSFEPEKERNHRLSLNNNNFWILYEHTVNF